MSELTPKQESFCQYYLECGNASDAYRRAYDSKAKPESVNRMAKEQLDNPKISSRVQEIRDELEERSLWKRLDSVKVLSEIAQGGERDNDRVSAVKALNSMHGWDAPKKIDHSSSDGSMSPQAVDADLVSALSKKLLAD